MGAGWNDKKIKGNAMITKLAVKWITRQLRKDSDLWMTYKTDIAMVIYDNIRRHFPLKTDPQMSPTLSEFCNFCAKDFLELWTKR